ncbi:hypothetical protein M433DRAFT_139075 [Acidomyces richmondensis BFW]|nr:MAG: hypothetical protein FE78DRAFT_35371 [Acidomyces sp. 'richmondensis']KYG50532.1 hypothetical protein M433DRAFT_139075 [Acidomyces richmondensis BFW]
MATCITDSYPIELHYIKALFLDQKYRHCIQACRNVVQGGGERFDGRPVQGRLFVNFYLALSHDELARMMHDCSPAKLPSFNQAKKFYMQALAALPEAEAQLQSLLREPPSTEADPFLDGFSDSASDRTQDQIEHDLYYEFASPPTSPTAHSRTDSCSAPLSHCVSREPSGSDLTDVESHSSFDQIMTPNRVRARESSPVPPRDNSLHRRPSLPRTVSTSTGLLQQSLNPNKMLARDVSRLSLLDDSPHRPAGLPLTVSTSRGLLKPIRMGSPAKAYYVPPQLTYTGPSVRPQNALPKLTTDHLQRPTRRPLRHEDDGPSPEADPVSPLGPNDNFSDDSTISPVSPVTPSYESGLDSLSLRTEEKKVGDSYVRRWSEHLMAMRTQLECHLAMLDKALEQTVAAQTARVCAHASASPSSSAPFPPVHANVNDSGTISRPGTSSSKHDSVISSSAKGLSVARSYWSFKPEEVKIEEKQKRIQEGRARGWRRERFDPKKYRELAEKAMAEL